jgi:hypothetical protein
VTDTPAPQTALAEALEQEFGEAVALDGGFSHGPSPEWWLERARALSERGYTIVASDLVTKVALCCSWGYAGVTCDDHLTLRAALARPEAAEKGARG